MRTAFVFCLLAAPLAYAQTTSTLFGTVTDKTGAVVPGAQVAASNTGTNQVRTVSTNTQGDYRMEFMPMGDYTVEISATGFKKFVQKDIALGINVPARVDATLDVGTMTEDIDVTAAPPTVNTDNAQIGRTVENAEITNLPIVGRNVYTLLSPDLRAFRRLPTASCSAIPNSAP